MELRHLRYFLAVAEERNFTRAAERLHVAQPAVSAQVRELEARLGGVKLLERDSHRVELTAAGEVLFAGAKRLLRELEETAERARRVSRGETGQLTIGFIGSQSHERMPQVLRRFRDGFPGVELRLLEMVPSQQLEALQHGRLDVGFVGPMAEGRPPAGLEIECVAEEPPVVGLPSGHSLLAGGRTASLTLGQLRDEAFIFTSRENSPAYRSWLDRVCRQAGFEPRVVQEVDRARTGVQYVAAGFGISIFAEHLSRFPAPGVKFVPLRPLAARIRYGVAWRKRPARTVVAQLLEQTRRVFGPAKNGS